MAKKPTFQLRSGNFGSIKLCITPFSTSKDKDRMTGWLIFVGRLVSSSTCVGKWCLIVMVAQLLLLLLLFALFVPSRWSGGDGYGSQTPRFLLLPVDGTVEEFSGR